MLNLSNYSDTVKVLALCRYAGVGPRLFDLLLSRYGSVDEVLSAERASLGEIKEITAKAIDRIIGAVDRLDEAKAESEKLAGRDIRIVTRFDDAYPALLYELNDPPPLLYVRGALPRNDGKTVTLVGAGEPTNEGLELTVKLAKAFAEAGVQVVSSLRVGIDAAAHLGTKAAQHNSFAVLDTGFDHIDSTEQMPIAIDAVQAGGVITEYPPERKFSEENYRESNRLLAALGHAVVVTELYDGSREILDLVMFCSQIGKMVFLMVDPTHGPLSDPGTLDKLTEYGVIPMVGLDQVDKIIAALV